MYAILLFFHSLFRWLVLSSLVYAILRAYSGLRSHGEGRLCREARSDGDPRLHGNSRLLGDSRLFGDSRSHGESRLFGESRSRGVFFPGRPFTKADDSIRHWTATIAHIQLTIGCVLYFTSPLIKLFWAGYKDGIARKELSFFGIVHMSLMLLSIVLITIGSALAKRKTADADKFGTMFRWFSIALLLILIAIPWPFSPLAGRPLFRTF